MYVAGGLDAFLKEKPTVPNVFYMRTFFIPSFEIWNRTMFSCLKFTEAIEGMLLFLLYLCKLSA